MKLIREEHLAEFVREFSPSTTVEIGIAGFVIPESFVVKNEVASDLADTFSVLVKDSGRKTGNEIQDSVKYVKDFSDSFYTTYKREG